MLVSKYLQSKKVESDISQVFWVGDILQVGKDNTDEKFVVQPQSMSEYLTAGHSFFHYLWS